MFTQCKYNDKPLDIVELYDLILPDDDDSNCTVVAASISIWRTTHQNAGRHHGVYTVGQMNAAMFDMRDA